MAFHNPFAQNLFDAIHDHKITDQAKLLKVKSAVEEINNIPFLIEEKIIPPTSCMDLYVKDESGYSVFDWSIFYRKINIVRFFLASDQKPSIKDMTAGFFMAIQLGAIEIVRLLLSTKKINLSSFDQAGKTPLWLAVHKKDLNLVKLFLDYNAQVDKDVTNLVESSFLNDAPAIVELFRDQQAMQKEKFFISIKTGNLKELETLLKLKMDLNNINDSETKESPVECALSHGFVNIAILLIREGAKKTLSFNPFFLDLILRVVTIDQMHFFLPLFNQKSLTFLLKKAFEEERIPVVKSLANYIKAFLEIEEKRSTLSHEEELSLAMQWAGIDVNQLDESGKPPLFYAVKEKKIKLIEFYLSIGAKPVEFDKSMTDFLIEQLRNRELFRKTNAEIERITHRREMKEDVYDSSYTKLLLAANDNPNPEISGDLISTPKLELKHINKDKQRIYTVFAYAINKKDLHLLSFLLKRDINPNVLLLPEDKFHVIPWLFEGNAVPIEKMQFFLDMFLKAGANPSKQTFSLGNNAFYTFTPLVRAAKYNDILLCEKFIRAGANLNDADETGTVALNYAVKNKYFELAELLLRAGANPNLPSLNKNTPLIDAILNDDLAIFKLLLHYKASPTEGFPLIKPLFFSLTPSHKKKHRYEMISTLLDAKADPNQTQQCQFLKGNINPIEGAPFFNVSQVTAMACAALDLEDRLKNEGEDTSKIITRLLAAGANLDSQERKDALPEFTAAVHNGNMANISLLLEKKANVNINHLSLGTPLHLAVAQCNVNATELLLDHNADVNIGLGNPAGLNSIDTLIEAKVTALNQESKLHTLSLLFRGNNECKFNSPRLRSYLGAQNPLDSRVLGIWQKPGVCEEKDEAIHLYLTNLRELHIAYAETIEVMIDQYSNLPKVIIPLIIDYYKNACVEIFKMDLSGTMRAEFLNESHLTLLMDKLQTEKAIAMSFSMR